MSESLEREIVSVAALSEPVRRALYFFVAARRGEVSRDEAAEAVAISRALAAFHLDRLVEQGLLEAGYRRLTGKSGPGAGRPAKVYWRATRQLDVSLPPRRYALAARLLARALVRSRGRRTNEDLLAGVARDAGQAIGAEARLAAGPRARRTDLRRAACDALDSYGFDPVRTRGSEIRLRNCPFDALAQEHRDLVCGMNLSLIQGMLAGLGESGLRAELDPAAGMCCVTLRPRK